MGERLAAELSTVAELVWLGALDGLGVGEDGLLACGLVQLVAGVVGQECDLVALLLDLQLVLAELGKSSQLLLKGRLGFTGAGLGGSLLTGVFIREVIFIQWTLLPLQLLHEMLRSFTG